MLASSSTPTMLAEGDPDATLPAIRDVVVARTATKAHRAREQQRRSKLQPLAGCSAALSPSISVGDA